ncbi:MAG: GGDEF domain-containing protein [Lachnospiraceae bacterium]|nr:GGDEF domain-containing protein [Lachnospiraceae bacterium]
MKIERSTRPEDAKRKLDIPLYECSLFVRKDLTVSSASRSYYEFVGENSILPFTDLIEPEDASTIREAVSRGCGETVEVYTRLYNRIDTGWRNVYVRVEACDRREDGQLLFLVTVLDVADTYARMLHLDKKANKYRYYMSIKDEYYFEYYPETNRHTFYKYVNGKAIMIFDGDYDAYTQKAIENAVDRNIIQAQCDQLTRLLKNKSSSFELIWRRYGKESRDDCYKLIGGVCIYNPEMVTGIIIPQSGSDSVAYYLSAAGKDSFTGLLNKKASIEYSIDKLGSSSDGSILWMIIMDIDDFKSVNDNYGHSFGDEVIKFVADTLQKHLGRYGVVGRFGGDEFYSLIHDIPTREELKLVLKVIAREILYQFDSRIKLTLSVGVSQFPKDGTSFDLLFGKADKSLYIAKEKGKNRHIIYDEKLHGAYVPNAVGPQNTTGVLSREKRRNMLIRCISEMNASGIEAFLKNDNLCQGLLDLFDLGGITIYGDYGKSVLLRKGTYRHEPEDRTRIAADGAYAAQYEHETVMIINTPNKLKTVSEYAYRSALQQEIGASVRCVVKKEHIPYIFVDFDVFDVNRKWSDSDVEILSALGCMIGEMIKMQSSGKNDQAE